MTHSIPDSSAVALGHRPRHRADHRRLQVRPDARRRPAGGRLAPGRARAARACCCCAATPRTSTAPGFSPSESVVGPHLEEVFARCEGRIVVTSFASNIHRVQQVVDAADALDRKVALVGRSMRKNVGIGRNARPHRGARRAARRPARDRRLPRRARRDHLHRLPGRAAVGAAAHGLPRPPARWSSSSGDTVVFSATPIPGNERAVNETIDRLYHIGCDVITPRDAPVHASGHGYAEEVKLMLNLVKPRYVMPFHGDFKRLRLHAQLAEAVGVAPEDIFQGDNGLPLDIDERGARFGEPEQSGMIFVDGVEIGDMADVALRDRRMLSADGIFIVVVTIAEQDGRSVADPEVIFRGVPFLDQADELLEEIRATVDASLRARRQGGDPRGRPAAADAARRSREASLRPSEAAADGPARRRRGLSRRAGARRSARPAALRRGSSVTRAAVGLGDGLHDRQARGRRSRRGRRRRGRSARTGSGRARRDARAVVLHDQLDLAVRRVAGARRGSRCPAGVWRSAFSSRLIVEAVQLVARAPRRAPGGRRARSRARR